ncbi:serine-threonine/tyrosine-protein kinase catalytic domain-containing protein [Artemisia annua]|uniref:non-specific serine/threonine protein kinase n=1 Tax=Artemisia annua TaxID=35608 RepID=A0A2U1P2V6_ARTAN|nr:serine-threonine/tyrosine-protein kinase catalytic domain-containing protein [Artemisia annua]
MGNCCPKPVNNFSSNSNKVPTQAVIIKDEKKKEPMIEKPPSKAAKEGNDSTGSGKEPVLPASGRIVTPNLKCFTFAELRSATRNFRPDTMLGEGGFGRVFKGWVDGETYAPSKVGIGIAVAVKKSSPDSAQGLKEWQAEVKFLGKFSHPNLVKLVGYCWEDREFLLVYEYMQKGSLENHLFKKGAEPLSWSTRIKIATGAAQGLAFLHTTEKTVIYRDFKSANILLDGDFNAKLSDFGLAKLGPANGESHVSTGVVGTYGYAAPEYIATGHLYVNSDVYGFGVVLLEIITGLRVLDTNRPGSQHNLVDWARPALPDKRKLKKILDPRLLEHDLPLKGAFKASELVLSCLEADPKNRPSMEEVVVKLQEISAIKPKPRETKVHTTQPTGPRRYQSANHSPLHKKPGGGVKVQAIKSLYK